jgi:hypothetical protein
MDPDLSFQKKIHLFILSLHEVFRTPAVASNTSISSKRDIFDLFRVSFLSSRILDLESIQSGSQTILAEHFRVKIRTKATAWIRICEKCYYEDAFMVCSLRQLTFNKICPVVSILELIQIKNRVNEAGQGSQIRDGKTDNSHSKEFIKEVITKNKYSPKNMNFK